eukprot:2093833-Pyramimonas_sp.AAC.1
MSLVVPVKSALMGTPFPEVLGLAGPSVAGSGTVEWGCIVGLTDVFCESRGISNILNLGNLSKFFSMYGKDSIPMGLVISLAPSIMAASRSADFNECC